MDALFFKFQDYLISEKCVATNTLEAYKRDIEQFLINGNYINSRRIPDGLHGDIHYEAHGALVNFINRMKAIESKNFQLGHIARLRAAGLSDIQV